MEEALLSKEELETEFLTFLLDVKDTPKRKLLKCIRNSTTRHAFFIHVLVLAIYSGIFFLLVQSQLRHESNRKPLIVSPATSALKIERRVLRNRVNATNPYKGLPSEELDQAWRELLRHSNIRLSAEELKEMGRTSVQLADGSGNYVGTLGLFPFQPKRSRYESDTNRETRCLSSASLPQVHPALYVPRLLSNLQNQCPQC